MRSYGYLYFDKINTFVFAWGEKFIQQKQFYFNVKTIFNPQVSNLALLKELAEKETITIYCNLHEDSLLFKHFSQFLKLKVETEIKDDDLLYEDLMGAVYSGKLGLTHDVYKMLEDERKDLVKTEGKINYTPNLLALANLVNVVYSSVNVLYSKEY